MYELALFAGAGGGVLGGLLSGWRCIGAVEIEGYPRGVLAQRQNDSCLCPFPIWDDVTTFRSDNAECAEFIDMLRGIADELVISGGFPCQDISCAGKGDGLDGERSGLWREYARIVGEIRPGYVLVENSPMLTLRGLDRVLGDLAALGFDAEWGVVSAADAIWAGSLAGGGVPALDHVRERIWIRATRTDALRCGSGKEFRESSGAAGPTAITKRREQWAQLSNVCQDADNDRNERDSSRAKEVEGGATGLLINGGGEDGDTDQFHDDGWRSGASQVQQRKPAGIQASEHAHGSGCEVQRERVSGGAEFSECAGWWESEPGVGRVADGVACRVDRLKAIGNGQVPDVVVLSGEVV